MTPSAVAQIDARVAIEATHLHGCWPEDECDFACDHRLRNIRADCGDDGIGMVPQSLMLHDGSPVCQWCAEVADYAACRASYFVDFWLGAGGVAAIRRCEWDGEQGRCRGSPESVQCGPKQSSPPPYPPLFLVSGEAPSTTSGGAGTSVLLRYAASPPTSTTQASPPPSGTLLNALELRAYRGGQIVANASLTASGVLASAVMPMLARIGMGGVEHGLQSGVAGELAAQNVSLLLVTLVATGSCFCGLALCCLVSRYRRIRVAEDEELESALGTPPESPRDPAAWRSGYHKKLARTVGRATKHRYEFQY